ncbi:MAG: hypothetical protein ACLP56_14070 [Candidatus Sulfotelmatobacter sp.]
MTFADATQRFSNRVADYARYRSSYPSGVVQLLREECGWIVVAWNDRCINETPFAREYEALLKRFGTDYQSVNNSYPRPEQMLAFFGANEFVSHSLPNHQEFDFEGLSGRFRSSSYAPPPGHPNYAPMMEELQRIFSAHQKDGVVRMEYRTRIYTGQLVN